jgi:hypothetical protein
MATPTYNPNYRDMPTYTAPRWNEGAIDALTQKRSAPGLRAMRQQVSRASGVSYDNPNMKRMTLRDALQGYGQGVEQTLSGANAAATNEYGNQFSAESEGSQAEFNSQANAINFSNQAEADRAKTNFGAGMEEWSNAQDLNKMAVQNKYAQSAREYLTSSQKDLMTFKKGLEGDDEWEEKLAAQMGYEKEMMRYKQDYEKDDWEAKMQKQYDLQEKAKESDWYRSKKQLGGEGPTTKDRIFWNKNRPSDTELKKQLVAKRGY